MVVTINHCMHVIGVNIVIHVMSVMSVITYHNGCKLYLKGLGINVRVRAIQVG